MDGRACVRQQKWREKRYIFLRGSPPSARSRPAGKKGACFTGALFSGVFVCPYLPSFVVFKGVFSLRDMNRVRICIGHRGVFKKSSRGRRTTSCFVLIESE